MDLSNLLPALSLITLIAALGAIGFAYFRFQRKRREGTLPGPSSFKPPRDG